MQSSLHDVAVAKYPPVDRKSMPAMTLSRLSRSPSLAAYVSIRSVTVCGVCGTTWSKSVVASSPTTPGMGPRPMLAGSCRCSFLNRCESTSGLGTGCRSSLCTYLRGMSPSSVTHLEHSRQLLLSHFSWYSPMSLIINNGNGGASLENLSSGVSPS